MIAFKADIEKIKVARDHVAMIAAGWPVDAYLVRVVVSELITNAIRHAVTDKVRVDARSDGRVCVVEVWTATPRFRWSAVPARTRSAAED